MLAMATMSIEAAVFEIRHVQNDAPSPTLLSCKVAIEKDKVLITASGYSRTLQDMIWQRDHAESPKFKDHIVTLEDDKVAADFLTIAKHFELCHQGSAMKLVSGGTITKIACVYEPEAPAKEAYYIAVDSSTQRAKLMEDICRDLQMLVVIDVLKEDKSKKNALEAIRGRCAKLAANISAYTQALTLVEDAYRKGLPADWKKISSLIQFRPNQPPLEKRSHLVRTAHDILTASCSAHGLQFMLSGAYSNQSALILKIGEVRRCRGSFSYPNEPDWGFDDIGTSLGFVYPPHNPGLRVGILDLGIERLLLHFLLYGAPDAPTAYDRLSLALSGWDWSVIKHSSFDKISFPGDTKERLQYLSAKSGLLEHLLDGKVPDRVVFVDITSIVIEDDKWKVARVDYRLGEEERVLPLFISEGAWLPNHPWTERAYRWDDNTLRNSDFFRSLAEVNKHNADKAGTRQPATRTESK